MMTQNLLKQLQSGLAKLQKIIRSSPLRTEIKKTLVNESSAISSSDQIIKSNRPDDLESNVRKLFVYNSFTKTKQLATANGNQIYLNNNEPQFAKAYICGPTVYDESHIGHAMTYLRFDLIRRVLKRYCSIDLVSIMNITDIDDKIIAKSFAEKKSYTEVSNYYLSSFLKDLHSLNILPFNAYVPVTCQIDNIIEYIQMLEKNGYAYLNAITGDIDLDTSKVDKELSKFKTDSILPGRRSESDFSLWKAHKSNEPYWEYRSTLTNQIIKGRPGWHVECSVISNSVLSNRIDFHFGGQDLFFPHHVNESRCCKAFNCVLASSQTTDEEILSKQLGHLPIHKWSEQWSHFGRLIINEEKMSKSLNNSIQIKKFLRKNSKNALRLLCIIHSYRTDITYNEGNLAAANDFDKKIVHFYQLINNRKNELIRSKLKYKDTSDLNALIESFVQHNLDGIADDFDLERGWSKLIELIESVNKDRELWSIYDLIKVEMVVSDYLTTLGLVFHGDSLSRSRNPNDQYIIRKFVDYRKEIRRLALEERVICANKSSNIDSILKHTDNVRNSLASNHLVIEDNKFDPVKKN